MKKLFSLFGLLLLTLISFSQAGIIGSAVPAVKTPIFIAAATDDELGLASHSVHIYENGRRLNNPRSYTYERGKHGFGMDKQNLPTDKWIDRFTDWLQMQGLLQK